MSLLTKISYKTCSAIVMHYFVQSTVGYHRQVCWSSGDRAVVPVWWPRLNLCCEQFIFLFFPFYTFFLEVSFYQTKDLVKSKLVLCKISKELFATQLTQIFWKFCKKREPSRLLVQLYCVIRSKIPYEITGSCCGQVEIVLLWQSGGPGSTCAVNNFFFFFFLFFWNYRFMTQRTR